MFCHNCGIELTDGSKFCVECGEPVFVANSTSDTIVKIENPKPLENTEQTITVVHQKSKRDMLPAMFFFGIIGGLLGWLISFSWLTTPITVLFIIFGIVIGGLITMIFNNAR